MLRFVVAAGVEVQLPEPRRRRRIRSTQLESSLEGRDRVVPPTGLLVNAPDVVRPPEVGWVLLRRDSKVGERRGVRVEALRDLPDSSVRLGALAGGRFLKRLEKALGHLERRLGNAGWVRESDVAAPRREAVEIEPGQTHPVLRHAYRRARRLGDFVVASRQQRDHPRHDDGRGNDPRENPSART
jgi:hypothetical protein